MKLRTNVIDNSTIVSVLLNRDDNDSVPAEAGQPKRDLVGSAVPEDQRPRVGGRASAVSDDSQVYPDPADVATAAGDPDGQHVAFGGVRHGRLLDRRHTRRQSTERDVGDRGRGRRIGGERQREGPARAGGLLAGERLGGGSDPTQLALGEALGSVGAGVFERRGRGRDECDRERDPEDDP